MKTTPPEAHPKPDHARQALLLAAIEAFGEHGEAGARTDAIAKAAGVNKALLHYYFGTKDALYGAVLEHVFTGIVDRFSGVLQGPGTAGERLLGYCLAHFDHLAASGPSGRLMGHELMRARAGESGHLPTITRLCFGPLHVMLGAALAEGMDRGELRVQAPGPVLMSLIGTNVFYFMSGPVFLELSGRDPRDPDRLAQQRAALLELAATVLFADPEHGRRLAAAVLQR